MQSRSTSPYSLGTGDAPQSHLSPSPFCWKRESSYLLTGRRTPLSEMPTACLAGAVRASCAQGLGLRRGTTLTSRAFWKAILLAPHSQALELLIQQLRGAEPQSDSGSSDAPSLHSAGSPAPPGSPATPPTLSCHPLTAALGISLPRSTETPVSPRGHLLPERCGVLKALELSSLPQFSAAIPRARPAWLPETKQLCGLRPGHFYVDLSTFTGPGARRCSLLPRPSFRGPAVLPLE